jgi:hypothetical protein
MLKKLGQTQNEQLEEGAEELRELKTSAALWSLGARGG